MTISKFQSAPRRGHLDRMKRIYGYLCKYRHYKIRFRVDEPDYLIVPGIKNHHWVHFGLIRSDELSVSYGYS